MALSSAPMAATASSKHFDIKLIEYVAVMYIAAVTAITISSYNVK